MYLEFVDNRGLTVMFDSELFKRMVEKGVLPEDTYQKVLADSTRVNKTFFDLIIEEGVLKEDDIVQFWSKEKGMSFVSKISESQVDPALLSKVPFKFLRHYSMIPIFCDSKITILISNPKSIQSIDEISLFLPGEIGFAFASQEVIVDAINRYYPFDVGKEAMDELEAEEEDSFDLDDIREQDIMEMANDAPIVKLVNHIIFQSIKEGSSDVHIEPFEKELRVRYRIDGVMHHKFSPPRRYHGAIISRIKIMSNLNIAEKRIPQDGRIQLKVAEKPIDLRVSVLPCNYGERVVMRILDKSKGIAELETLNLNERDYQLITKMIERPNGIILVTGPTGSGKTTTLYSVLSRLNDEDSNIITVEDPVEYTINGINQVQVNVKTGLTFSAALRSILRQDPDIALIGEIRDGETAQIATQAALTGHLVLSTIHTNSAPATITRLVDMEVEPFLIASSIVCVIAQRLVRSLCPQCREESSPTAEILARFGIKPESVKDKKFYKAVGCGECLKTGYKGRLALFEVMEIDDDVASLIVKKADASEIRKIAVTKGMTTLAADGVRKAAEGLTTLEEVLSVAVGEG